MDGAILYYLKKRIARGHHLTVVIAPIQTPERPAATVFESFDEAVARSGLRVSFDRVAAVFLLQEDRFQVDFAAVRRFHKAVCDKPAGALKCSKAERSPIRGIERDLVGGLHTETVGV